MSRIIHQGRNVKRFREMLGIKQEGLAYMLGEDWNQKKISSLEQKDLIDDQLLEGIAKKLKVPADAIKNFDEEMAVYNIQNNYEGSNTGATGVGVGEGAGNQNHHCTFNPLEKYIEAMEENKCLYEQLLTVEREKIALLQKMLDKQ